MTYKTKNNDRIQSKTQSLYTNLSLESKLVFWDFAAFVLTLIHHIYGEFFYFKDGQRLSMVYGAPLLFLLTFILYWYYRQTRNRIALYGFVGWSLLIWFVGLGLFENLWSHTVLDILFILNIPETTLANYFLRTSPGDWFFEITGTGGFPLALLIFYYSYRLLRRT